MSLEVSPTTGFTYLFDNVNDNLYEKSKNPIIFAVLISIIIIYVLIFNYLGISHTPSKVMQNGQSVKVIELILWGVFLFLIFVNALQYFFEVDFRTSIKNMFGDNPQIDIDVLPNKSFENNMQSDEVFHIGDNIYTYEEAKLLCNAHDGELASYNQIEKAYNNGAEWCSYGWSDDQLALFPTQKDTYKHLQGIEGHENDCGRPGINGGFIANPAVRFGANCFGYKPKITGTEQKAMDTDSEYPKTRKDMVFERRVDYWRQKLPEVTVAPFNKTTWSKV